MSANDTYQSPLSGRHVSLEMREVCTAPNSGERTKIMAYWLATGRIFNAHTMEERCDGIKMCGGTFYGRPENYEYVKPLVEGFGEYEERKEISFEEGGWWI